MKKLLLISTLFFFWGVCSGQDELYVTAISGLNVRSEPSISSTRMGKLEYASKVEVLEYLDDKLTVQDHSGPVHGYWVRIKYKLKDGYVFSGFLTPISFPKQLDVKFENLTFVIQGFDGLDNDQRLEQEHHDTANVAVGLGGTPEYKYVKILQSKFQKVALFQRHENSITIMNEGPHCDLTEWKHFDSNWKEVPFIDSQNAFRTLSYSGEDWTKFISIDPKELQAVVRAHCGEFWAERAKTVKHATDYPSGVSISRIFF